jgi:hypothetical protein
MMADNAAVSNQHPIDAGLTALTECGQGDKGGEANCDAIPARL